MWKNGVWKKAYSSIWKTLKFVESSYELFIAKKAEYRATGGEKIILLYYEIWWSKQKM